MARLCTTTLRVVMLCGLLVPQSAVAFAPASGGSGASGAPAPASVADLQMVRRALAEDRPADAQELLLDAIRAGFNDFSRLRRDPRLADLRDTRTCQAVFAARDAADPLLAQRQARLWRDRIARDGEPRMTEDDQRRVLLVTTLGHAAHDVAFRVLCEMVDGPAPAFSTRRSHYIVVVILPPSAAARYFPSRHVHGRYLHRARVLLARDLGRPLRHELAHARHHQEMDQLGQEHPIWVQEGFASLLESARFDAAGMMTIAANERDLHARRLVEGEAMHSWSALLAMSKRQFEADAAKSYAQARSIFLFMHEQGLLEKWYRIYVTSFDTDPYGGQALEKAFGEGLEQIEADWLGWVLSRRIEQPDPECDSPLPVLARHEESTGRLRPSIEDLSGEESEMAPPRLREPGADPAVVAWEQARALYGRGAYAEAGSALRSLLEVRPDHADARYLLGLSLIRLGDVDAAAEEQQRLLPHDRSLASLLTNLLPREGSERPGNGGRPSP